MVVRGVERDVGELRELRLQALGLGISEGVFGQKLVSFPRVPKRGTRHTSTFQPDMSRDPDFCVFFSGDQEENRKRPWEPKT